jgi:heme oxygenase
MHPHAHHAGRPDGLAARLRAATAAGHQAVEGSPLMQRIFTGTIGRADYAAYLAALAPAYEALETALERQLPDGPLAQLALAVPPRLPGLLADLRFLGAPPARGGRMAERIAGLMGSRVHRLAAWAWARYGGDLAGGQILAGVLGPALGLAPDRGLAFYGLPAGRGPGALRAALREAIDGLALGAGQHEELEDEAVIAFGLHEALFAELDGRRPGDG